jgi:hypothetical protein
MRAPVVNDDPRALRATRADLGPARVMRRWGVVLLVVGVLAVAVGVAIHLIEADTHRLCEETNTMARRIDVGLARPCPTSPLAMIVMVAGGVLAVAGVAIWIVATTRVRAEGEPGNAPEDRSRGGPKPPA